MDLKNLWIVIGNDPIMKGLLSVLSTMFVTLFGVPDLALKAIITLVVLDLIAKVVKVSYDNGGLIKGLIRALKKRKLSSRVAANRTLYKLVRYALTLAAFNQISLFIPIGITYAGYELSEFARLAGFMYVGWSEFISILETLVGIDGEDIGPIVDAARKARRGLTDRLLDKIMNSLAEKLGEHNNKNK